jgi:hypothetical protein
VISWREGHKLQVLVNEVFRKIFGSKKDKETEGLKNVIYIRQLMLLRWWNQRGNISNWVEGEEMDEPTP